MLFHRCPFGAGQVDPPRVPSTRNANSPVLRLGEVSDFGLSRLVEDGEYLSTSAGTPSHMAPEVHEKRRRGEARFAAVFGLGGRFRSATSEVVRILVCN